MTRFRSINCRVARIAAAKVPDVPVPSVLRVAFGENKAEAYARFNAAYPHRKPGHNVLVVPAKPSTPEEHALYEARFKASQLKLVAEARSNRAAAVNVAAPEPQPPFPQGGTVAPPRGRAFTQWKRNT